MQGQGCFLPATRSCKGSEGSSYWELFVCCLSLLRKHLLEILLRKIIIKILEIKATSFKK